MVPAHLQGSGQLDWVGVGLGRSPGSEHLLVHVRKGVALRGDVLRVAPDVGGHRAQQRFACVGLLRAGEQDRVLLHVPLRLLADHEVPIPDDATILVYSGMRLEGGIVATNHAAVEFDEFARGLGLGAASAAPVARRMCVGPKPPRMREDAVEELLARHPWLDRDDIMSAKVRNPPKKARTDCHQEESPEDMPEDDEEAIEVGVSDADVDEVDVDAELAAVREELGAAADDDEHSMLRSLGGRWTQAHVGEAADVAMAIARGGLATSWATALKFPKSKRFHFSKYGRDGARQLAREVARRGNFFCNQYHKFQGDYRKFRQTSAMADQYLESVEWLDWVIGLDNNHPCFAAALQVRALRPACVGA